MRRVRPLRQLPALLCAAVLAACVAPQYDDQTDKLISQLQSDVDTQLVTLISLDHKIAALSQRSDPASQKALTEARIKASYDANTGFYDKIDVDLTSLQTRVDSEPTHATPDLDRSILLLRQNLVSGPGSLQQTHEAQNILSEPYLRSVEQIVNAQMGALLTREIGLKAGSK